MTQWEVTVKKYHKIVTRMSPGSSQLTGIL